MLRSSQTCLQLDAKALSRAALPKRVRHPWGQRGPSLPDHAKLIRKSSEAAGPAAVESIKEREILCSRLFSWPDTWDRQPNPVDTAAGCDVQVFAVCAAPVAVRDFLRD